MKQATLFFRRFARQVSGCRKFAGNYLHYLKRGYRCTVAWRLARNTL